MAYCKKLEQTKWSVLKPEIHLAIFVFFRVSLQKINGFCWPESWYKKEKVPQISIFKQFGAISCEWHIKYGKTSHFLFLFSFFDWHNPILYMKMSVFQFQEQIKVWMILGLLATNNHLPRLKTIMVLVKESRKIRKYPKNKNTQNLLSRKKVVPRSFYAWLKTHDHSIWFNSTTV